MHAHTLKERLDTCTHKNMALRRAHHTHILRERESKRDNVRERLDTRTHNTTLRRAHHTQTHTKRERERLPTNAHTNVALRHKHHIHTHAHTRMHSNLHIHTIRERLDARTDMALRHA